MPTTAKSRIAGPDDDGGAPRIPKRRQIKKPDSQTEGGGEGEGLVERPMGMDVVRTRDEGCRNRLGVAITELVVEQGGRKRREVLPQADSLQLAQEGVEAERRGAAEIGVWPIVQP